MKSNKLPMISVIICSYNAPKLISKCIDSILEQRYLGKKEILVLEGGSNKKNLQKIKEYAKDKAEIRIIHNKNKLPEGQGMGKWLGSCKANGKIIGFIDQDNLLQKKDLFLEVNKIFNKKGDIAGISGGLMHDKNDSLVIRYVSLVGTDSFFAYRSLDFIRRLRESRKNWKGYETILLGLNNMPLTGGNCFFYLKKDLELIGGYDQDVLVLQRLIKKGKNRVVVIPNSTKHYAEKDIYSLINKKFYWGRKYYERKDEAKFDYFPKTKLEKNKFYKNIIFNILIFPNLFYSIKLYKQSKDMVSFLFPFISFFNTIAYGINFALSHKQMHLRKLQSN